jgi:hypothetical protein
MVWCAETMLCNVTSATADTECDSDQDLKIHYVLVVGCVELHKNSAAAAAVATDCADMPGMPANQQNESTRTA